MRIEHLAGKHRFEALSDKGERMGEIDYAPEAGGEAISATHTWVSSDFRGQGVAGKLLDALVGHARTNGLKIIPVCSYVVSAFEKDPDRYRDVCF